MNKFLAIVIAVILLAGAGWVYYYFAYPPVVLKHKTAKALDDFSAVIATQDRSGIVGAVRQMLTDNAQIKLTVQIPTPNTNTSAASQDFDKEQFLSFMDNVLYSLKDYSFAPRLQAFTPSPDHQSADMTFTVQGGAVDTAYYGTPTGIYFASNITCSAKADFHTAAILLSGADCNVQLHIAIKPPPGKESN